MREYRSHDPSGSRQQQQPHRKQRGRRKIDNTTDTCARLCGLILVFFACGAVAFTVITAWSCQFLMVEVEQPELDANIREGDFLAILKAVADAGNRTGNSRFLEEENIASTSSPTLSPTLALESTKNTSANTTNETVELGFGVFFYKNPRLEEATTSETILHNDKDNEACYSYNVQKLWDNHLPFNLRWSRIGILWTLLTGGLATFVILLEFCFLRIGCSRVLISFGFFSALCGIPLVFLLFADWEICNPFRSTFQNWRGAIPLVNSRPKSNDDDDLELLGCEMGSGAVSILWAGAFYLIAFVLSCIVPKSLPLVRVIDNMYHNGRFSCCQRSEDYPRQSYDDDYYPRRDYNDPVFYAQTPEDDELWEPLTKSSRADPVTRKETIIEGYEHKAYYDDSAGYTLQNQHTAAHERWLDAQADYDLGVQRFKAMVQARYDSTGNEWRRILKYSNQELSKRNNNIMMSEDESSLGVDEDVLRFAEFLSMLRENCDFAKAVMYRIQANIENHTAFEDECRSGAKQLHNR